jgi:hypothetical protein
MKMKTLKNNHRREGGKKSFRQWLRDEYKDSSQDSDLPRKARRILGRPDPAEVKERDKKKTWRKTEQAKRRVARKSRTHTKKEDKKKKAEKDEGK